MNVHGLELRLRSLQLATALCCALAALAQRAPVAAQDGGESAQYKKLIEEALQDFDRGNWEEAGALFAQAHALNPNARTLRGMGLSAFEARHYAEALRDLRAALDDNRKALTAKQRKEVEQSIERAQQYIGYVHFTLDPGEASIKINGEAVQLDADGKLMVDPGLLEIEASAPGYDTQLRRVRVSSGSTEEVALKLAIPREALPEPPAKQQLAPTGAPTPTANDSGGSNAIGALKWVTGGLAVAGLATGTIAFVLRDSAAKKWNACRDETMPSCVDQRDLATTDRTIGIIGLAVGGAFAIASVVLFVVDANASSSSERASACGPGPGELGMSCRLRF